MKLLSKYFLPLLHAVLFLSFTWSLYQMIFGGGVMSSGFKSTSAQWWSTNKQYAWICLFYIFWLSIVFGLKLEKKPTPIITLGTAQWQGEGNGTFPKYIRQKYFLALCLMYPNLGGTLQEIQAVGLGQQPELSDNCRGYIQGFMRALMDSRGSPLPVEALVQANAFVMKLLIDTDVLKSFVKDFKDNIEETIELIVNSNQEY